MFLIHDTKKLPNDDNSLSARVQEKINKIQYYCKTKSSRSAESRLLKADC